MISNREWGFTPVIHNKPGRYICRLSFELEGRTYQTTREVNNPAFGFAQLKDWEAIIVRRYERKGKAA